MGSMFSSPKPPAPMDVNKVQADANTQNVNNAYTNKAFNQQNQTDQFGNTISYNQTGVDAKGNPIFGVSQGLGGIGQQYTQGLSGLGQQYFNTAGQGSPTSQGAFDQAYQTASANLEPRFQRTGDALENKLRNQGLDPTSEAYKSAKNDLALQQNEARNNLVTSLQGQLFNQGLQSRQQQMNELNPGVQFGNNVLKTNAVNTPGINVGNVDVAGLNNTAFNQQYQNYNTKIQQQNAMLGGLAGIGGSLLMAPMTGGTSLGGFIGSKMLGGLGGMGGGGGGAANFPYGGTF